MTVNHLHTLIAASIFSVLCSSLLALPAAAESPEPLQVTVKFGDLDLSHPQAAAVLYGRIHRAADTVCSPFDGLGLSAKLRMDVCVKKAVSGAVTAVGNSALLAVYRAKMGITAPARVASMQYR